MVTYGQLTIGTTQKDGGPYSSAETLQLAENEVVGVYLDGRIAEYQDALAPAAATAFAIGGAVWDGYAVHVLKRTRRALLANPRKPNRIIFDRYPRRDDALESLGAILNFLELRSLEHIADVKDELALSVLEASAQQVS